MKNFLLLTICVLSLSLSAVCQVSKIYKSDLIDANVNRYLDHVPKDLFDISKTIESDGTIIIKDGVNVSISKLLTLVGCSGEEYTYKEERESKSLFNKNTYHQFYQQYYKGVKVDGGSYLISVVKDGTSDRILKFSPHLYNDINLSIKPTISIKNLRSKFSKESKKISNSSLIISFKYEQKPKLIWDIIISNSEDNHFQIDANNGTIYKKELSAVGLTGDTRNYQNVTLNDFTSNGVTKLRTPSGNIKIYQGTNIGTGTHVNLPDWNQNLIPSTTSTTTWNGGSASTTAIQSLFVANVVVNKYLEKLNISFPNVNIAVQQYGAETLLGSSTENAYMIIGYLHQNTPPNGPNYALYDVIAHELGHSHFFQFLDYDDNFNNGALHEGLADVFGTYIENYIKPNGTDWINANDDPEVGAFINRNHADKACLPDLDTEAHARGKVISHWFYSITQGIVEPGTNIPALGIETSMNIVREALNQLNFKKAGIEYFGYKTLNVVAAQYGTTGIQYEAVSKAWERVCVTPACSEVQDLNVETGQNITLNGSNSNGNITIKNGGKLTLMANIYMLPGKTITVQNGGVLSISANITSCGLNQSWKGIKVESGGTLNIILSSGIYNALNAIVADDNATISINGNLKIEGISSSLTGITLNGNVTFSLHSTLDITDCKTGILLINANYPNLNSNTKTIKNCIKGIYAKGGKVDIKNAFFENCTRPIIIENTTNLCIIADNTIKGYFYTGMECNNCSDVFIENNKIGSKLIPGWTGIYGISSFVAISDKNYIYATGRCINAADSELQIDKNYLFLDGIGNPTKIVGCIISGISKYTDISNNILISKNGNYGIFCQVDDGKSYINNNSITFELPNGPRSAALLGSALIGGEINANIIEGDPWAGGVHLQNSMGNTLECNNISGTGESMSVFYNSDFQTIRANTLSGTQDLVIRSVTGEQSHHGNKFIGGNTKAIGLTADEIFQSIFKVNQNITNNMPTNPIPGNGQWFVPENNPNPSNCNGIVIGPDWTPDPMRICAYFAYLKSIKDSLPERFFINLYHLLKYEKRHPGFTLPNCIKQDSTLLQLCGLIKIVDISASLDTIGHHPSLTKAVKILKAQYFAATDSLAKANLRQSIRQEWDDINLKLPAADIKDSLRLDSLQNELTNLLCDSLLINKWKEIFKLYIKFKQTGKVAESDTTMVKQYSSECADLYGDAIHLARVMASTFTDYNFGVNDDCIPLPVPRSKIIGVNEESIVGYPNPTSGIIQVKLPSQYIGQLKISDINGRMISKQDINNLEFLNLDLTSNIGINILHFMSQNGKVETIKVIVIQ